MKNTKKGASAKGAVKNARTQPRSFKKAAQPCGEECAMDTHRTNL